MKILLLITVCAANIERIKFQISNLNKYKDIIEQKNIIPVFVFGNTKDDIYIPYTKWHVDVEERYTNLYKKILKGFQKSLENEYDFLVKIDDDTIVNWDRFELNLIEGFDYIGRLQHFYTQNKITLDIPMYNLDTTINLYPKEFSTNFSFATGDFYILSRKLVEHIVSYQDYVLSNFQEEEYVCEDQLIGFLTLKDRNFLVNDINYSDMQMQLRHNLQITQNLLSIHPVNCVLFSSLKDKLPEDQLNFIVNKSSTNLYYRQNQISLLRKSLVKTVLDFANSNKLMGMG